MYTPITIATLALLTFTILLVRIFWLRLPAVVRFYLVRAAGVLIALDLLLPVTKWEINSDHWNTIVKWLAVASYELLVMLFTRLSPRWLTTVCAFILMVPVFASSVLMPLISIFSPTANELKPLSNTLFYQNPPWAEVASESTGSDLKIYYRPRFAPFLRHLILILGFNIRECDAHASFATLQPDGKHVLARCPHWPSQGPGSYDQVYALR